MSVKCGVHKAHQYTYITIIVNSIITISIDGDVGYDYISYVLILVGEKGVCVM